jgi:hypothetical protein
MSNGSSTHPIAGKDFPWGHISGHFLRLKQLIRVASIDGDIVGPAMMGAFGLAIMELANPDVEPEQRFISMPIEHKSDYKSLVRAHLDAGVGDGTNELVVVYEPRRGFLGGKKACLHVAAYPAGTWGGFFDAVSQYASKRVSLANGTIPVPTKQHEDISCWGQSLFSVGARQPRGVSHNASF